jgi:hypothetical protein
MKLPIYFFIFLFLFSLASATTLSGSPSSLNFDLGVGEVGCLNFSIYSDNYDGDLVSIMKWAGNGVDVSHPRDFNLNNSEVEFEVSYFPEEIEDFDGDEAVEVCVVGEKVGYWKGSLEYRTEASGNIATAVGTWLRVNVTEVERIEDDDEVVPVSFGGSGGGSRSSGLEDIEEEVEGSLDLEEGVDVNVLEVEVVDEGEVVSEGAGITGAAVSDAGDFRNFLILLFIVGVLGVVVYVVRRKKV